MLFQIKYHGITTAKISDIYQSKQIFFYLSYSKEYTGVNCK